LSAFRPEGLDDDFLNTFCLLAGVIWWGVQMSTIATVSSGGADKAFVLRLQRSQDEFSTLLSTWDRMTPAQQDACLEELNARSDALARLHSELVGRNTRRMSFMECVFLGVVLVCPMLFKFLFTGERFDPIEDPVFDPADL